MLFKINGKIKYFLGVNQEEYKMLFFIMSVLLGLFIGSRIWP